MKKLFTIKIAHIKTWLYMIIKNKARNSYLRRVLPLIMRARDMHAARPRSPRRARSRYPIATVSWAGRMRWYQRGEKIWPTVPGDVKSHTTTSKPGFSIACSDPSRRYENEHSSEGELVVFTRVYVFVLALGKTCYFLTTNCLQCLRSPVPISKWRRGPKAKLS